MATSRIGGTSGKLKGQVGSVIYQVKKNPDGTYTQYVYNKGVRTEETITPKLQAQRMCVAIVESLMADLKPVARISFQSGRNKTQSLNGFSANNIRLVQRDCKDHWYSGNTFVYPYHHRTDINIKDLGGAFIISSGSLNRNVFDDVVEETSAKFYYKNLWTEWPYLYGLTFSCALGTETLDQFLTRRKMTRSDQVVFCGYRDYYNYDTEPDDPTEFSRNEYMIVSLNMRMPGSTILTPEVLNDLFIIDSSMDCQVFIRRDNSGFLIGHLTYYMERDEVFYYIAGFTISHWGGKKQISTSFYTDPDRGQQPWLYDHAPADIFGSWMGEPGVVPYPSPF